MTKRFLLLSALCAMLCSCGRDTRPVLYLYNWSDYMNPDVITQFEREFECRVTQDSYDSNEVMFAKLRARSEGYDIVFPSSYQVSIMEKQGMLLPIDHSLIPNLANIDPDFLALTEDPEMRHSVPYMISTAGIAYLGSRVEDAPASWSLFERADLAGRMTLLDDMREVIGAALKYLGYSLNTTSEDELNQAFAVVQGWKKNIAKFAAEEYKQGLVSAEFLLVHGYNGDIVQMMDINDDIVFVLPGEGSSLASDEMVILKNSRNPELAHAFINFIHRPDIAAQNMEYVYYYSPNKAALELLSEDLRNNEAVIITEEVMRKCEVIRDLGEHNRLYTALWDRIKAE